MRSLTSSGLTALFSIALVWVGVHEWLSSTLTVVDELRSRVGAAHPLSAAAALQPNPEPALTIVDTADWPSRHTVDALVEQASQNALRQGLAIRAVSVAHHAATPSVWGRVVLEVSTTGPYAAQKSWQASLQKSHPALAVQSVRWQATPASGSGLDAQWSWVLHVRD